MKTQSPKANLDTKSSANPMTERAPSRRIHPLVATAAVSVTALSLAGVAALSGLISTPFARTASPIAAQTSSAPAGQPLAQPASIAQPAPVAQVATPVEPARAQAAPPQAPRAQAPRPPAPRTESPRVEAPRQPAPRPLPAPVASAPAIDPTLATVLSVQRVEEKGEGSGIGAVGGGVVGGVLGNQVGGGNGKKAMTVLGAIGGAVAGNAIEKKARAVSHYDVTLRMGDGSTRVVRYNEEPAFNAGQQIRVDPNRAS